MSFSPRLPIDSVIPDILSHLDHPLILVAPPGTGKTTRVPPALLSQVVGQIIVLEPRRLAARLSAERVAAELRQKVGEAVGYRFRGETRESSQTRISFYTEGTFVRRLVNDPNLDGVGAVVLDEFHERHLSGDLALAWIKHLRATGRPDLKLIVMSATLEVESLKRFLPDSKVLQTQTASYPLELEYFQKNASPVEILQHLCTRSSEGNILVFLPGKKEIEFWSGELRGKIPGYSVCPLHGDLSKEQQQRAIEVSPEKRIILSTNIAESSLTIPGVRSVIDSGVARRADEDSATGVRILRTVKVSQSSATQRAGRAARLGPGLCLRLYSKFDFEGRPHHDRAEVTRLDLARTLLEMKGAGLNRFSEFEWFEDPGKERIAGAIQTLRCIGALSDSESLTESGRKMLQIPLHPRHSRILLEARKFKSAHPVVWASVCSQVSEWEQRTIEERWFQDPKTGSFPAFQNDSEREAWIYLTGFSDRVEADPANPKTHGRVALEDFEIQGAQGAFTNRKVGKTIHFPVDWLLDLDPSPVVEERGWIWDPNQKRVRGLEILRAGNWKLEEKAIESDVSDPEGFSVLLRDGVGIRNRNAEWPELFERLNPYVDRDALETAVVQIGMYLELWNHSDLFQEFSDTPFSFLIRSAPEVRALSDLKSWQWSESFLKWVPYEDHRRMKDWFPERLDLPSGRKARVSYSRTEAPWVESRIQDFFGLHKTPTIAGGKKRLVVKMLAPNGRPAQVTQDLEGFWTRSYPEIRKELRARYPKHAWPEKP